MKHAAPAVDIGIPEPQRQAIADGLARLLADTYSLYLKTHAFHWNVEGPMFNTLHEMFMVQYTELWNALDEIAERYTLSLHDALPICFYAPGTYGEFARLSTVKETEGVPAALEMVALLVAGHEAVARTARAAFAAAEKGGDEATADLLTQRLSVHEKTAWMLRSLLRG